MNTLQRYDVLESSFGGVDEVESLSGEYVRYEDHEKYAAALNSIIDNLSLAFDSRVNTIGQLLEELARLEKVE